MPSGHSALAFSLFTSITLLSGNALISSLSMLMALMALLTADMRPEFILLPK